MSEGTEIIMFSRTVPPCHGCVAMKPIMENIPNSRVLDINTDEGMRLAQLYRVQAMPTFVKLVDGVFTSRLTGAMPQSKLVKWVAQA